MTDHKDPTPTALRDRSHEGSCGLAAGASGHLPIVIRPRPLELRQLERLLLQGRGLARKLAANPLHLHSVARTVFHRDGEAQARFADAEALASHLLALL